MQRASFFFVVSHVLELLRLSFLGGVVEESCAFFSLDDACLNDYSVNLRRSFDVVWQFHSRYFFIAAPSVRMWGTEMRIFSRHRRRAAGWCAVVLSRDRQINTYALPVPVHVPCAPSNDKQHEEPNNFPPSHEAKNKEAQ
ncbi:unnamed protein product [Amoebophrya sp. A120]|nr:unnamed protein product [Amoebophrya sp. A120]|eukprot:GSA120T00007458001.1